METQYPSTNSTHLPASFSYAVTSSLSSTIATPTPIVTQSKWAININEMACIYIY